MKRCPRCNAKVFKDWVDYYCLTCGIVDPAAPPRAPSEQDKEEAERITQNFEFFIKMLLRK